MSSPIVPSDLSVPLGLTAEDQRLDEEELLGALLAAPEYIDEVRSKLQAADFHDPYLKQVFSILLTLPAATLQGAYESMIRSRIAPPFDIGWGTLLADLLDKGSGLTQRGVLARTDAILSRSLDRRRRDLFIRMGRTGAEGDDLPKAMLLFQQEAAEIDRVAMRGSGLTLNVITASDLLGLRLPTRKYVLTPTFREKDLVMVYGSRGIAKTWVVEGIATAIASGGRFLEWVAEEARRVLLVDGELPIELIQERIRILCDACDLNPGDNLKILARDLQDPGAMPNLAEPGGQALIERLVDGIDVVVLDNVSTLFVGGVENEAESWECAQAFLLRLRQRGITVVFAHHAGRSGQPRGTSKREDILDTIIELKHPKDYLPTQGARFELSYTKARGALGQSVSPLEAWLQVDPTSGQPAWTLQGVEEATFERVVSLLSDGLTQTEIAKDVGKNKGYISRLAARAKKEGRVL